jgi:hypothetical protein
VDKVIENLRVLHERLASAAAIALKIEVLLNNFIKRVLWHDAALFAASICRRLPLAA